VVSHYSNPSIHPLEIAEGADAAMWFTNSNSSIGRISDVPVPRLSLNPPSGPPSTQVQVSGSGFGAFEKVRLSFVDSLNGTTALGTTITNAAGNFAKQVTIPANATSGSQTIEAKGTISRVTATQVFTVT